MWCRGGSRTSMDGSSLITRDSDTLTPSLMSSFACRIFSAVSRFRVPFWSSSPHRPQLLRLVNNCSTVGERGRALRRASAANLQPGRVPNRLGSDRCREYQRLDIYWVADGAPI